MDKVIVLDQKGQKLSATSREKAERLLAAGKASLIRTDPATIQLDYTVTGSPNTSNRTDPDTLIGQGKSILVHICCAPCATYTVRRLRGIEFDVTGYWYNPNIHPFSEHERRRDTLKAYAQRIDLPVIWEKGYDLVDFMRLVHGHEQFRIRCMRCYQMRLECTAAIAAQKGFDCITSTLLISPYQDQAAIRKLGEHAAAQYGVTFYFENFRQGWSEHFATIKEEQLYSQRYCGCIYSEWESLDRQAATLAGNME